MANNTKHAELDLLSGPLWPLILRIAVPASVGFFFNTMYNVVDTYFAGMLSADALAGMSMSFPVFIAILAIALGVGTGTTTLISNALGAGKSRDAVTIQAQAITLSIITAVALTFAALPFLPILFSLFRPEASALVHAVEYSRTILLGGTIFFALNFTLNAGLNARGLTKIYRNLLIVSFFANIGLDPLFLFGLEIGGVQIVPAMGISGIALATVIVQFFGALYLIFQVFRCRGLQNCKTPSFVPKWSIIRQIIKQGLPAAIDMSMIAGGATVIVAFLGSFGTVPIAAYGIALRIEQIALIPSIGLNIALSAIAGQNNGARNYDRIQKAYAACMKMGVVLLLGIMVPILIFNRPIIAIFTSDADIALYARSYLFTQSLAFYSYILLFQSRSVLEGIKRPGIIAWIGASRQILLPLLLFPLFASLLAVTGIWLGIVAINWIAALFLLFVTRRNLKGIILAQR